MHDTDLFLAFKRHRHPRRIKLPDKVKLRANKRSKWFREKKRWLKQYNAYLRSEKWKIKREKRLKICKGICEICNSAPAVHVHHLNYKRVFKERMSDLKGICIACHKKAHPGKKFSLENQKESIDGTKEVEF
jgi:hypothetical protein